MTTEVCSTPECYTKTDAEVCPRCGNAIVRVSAKDTFRGLGFIMLCLIGAVIAAVILLIVVLILISNDLFW